MGEDLSPTRVTGLDHVQVAAPPGCEAAARAFYAGLLGLAEIEKPPSLAGRGGCWFQAGSQQVHVGVADAFQPAAKAHPGLRVATAGGLRRLAARFDAAGVAYTWAAEGEIPGRLRLHVHDTFGNRVELLADA